MEASIAYEFNEIQYDQKALIHFMVSLKCLKNTNHIRSPVNLILCIDKSGSMSGKKMELVKESMHFIVDQLTDQDRIALITFNTEVSVDAKFTSMSDFGKKEVRRCIEVIHAGSSTDLWGGIEKAFELLKHQTESPKFSSILLFTDGLTNCGVTNPINIQSKLDFEIRSLQNSCSVFSFGFGEDHDANLLGSIATRGSGVYYHVQNETEIRDSFANCLGGLLSVGAQNITVSVPKDSVCLSKWKSTVDDELSISLGAT